MGKRTAVIFAEMQSFWSVAHTRLHIVVVFVVKKRSPDTVACTRRSSPDIYGSNVKTAVLL